MNKQKGGEGQLARKPANKSNVLCFCPVLSCVRTVHWTVQVAKGRTHATDAFCTLKWRSVNWSLMSCVALLVAVLVDSGTSCTPILSSLCIYARSCRQLPTNCHNRKPPNQQTQHRACSISFMLKRVCGPGSRLTAAAGVQGSRRGLCVGVAAASRKKQSTAQMAPTLPHPLPKVVAFDLDSTLW